MAFKNTSRLKRDTLKLYRGKWGSVLELNSIAILIAIAGFFNNFQTSVKTIQLNENDSAGDVVNVTTNLPGADMLPNNVFGVILYMLLWFIALFFIGFLLQLIVQSVNVRTSAWLKDKRTLPTFSEQFNLFPRPQFWMSLKIYLWQSLFMVGLVFAEIVIYILLVLFVMAIVGLVSLAGVSALTWTVGILLSIASIVALAIPFIVLYYRLSLSFFIYKDDVRSGKTDSTALDYLNRSNDLMSGNVWRRFILDLSFIGWFLLMTLTMGLIALRLTPYMNGAHAAFYNDLVENQDKKSEPKAKNISTSAAKKTVAKKATAKKTTAAKTTTKKVAAKKTVVKKPAAKKAPAKKTTTKRSTKK